MLGHNLKYAEMLMGGLYPACVSLWVVFYLLMDYGFYSIRPDGLWIHNVIVLTKLCIVDAPVVANLRMSVHCGTVI